MRRTLGSGRDAILFAVLRSCTNLDKWRLPMSVAPQRESYLVEYISEYIE